MIENAFVILGRARAAFKKAGIPKAEIDRITKEATTGDYYHLVGTLMDFAEEHKVEI